MFKDVVLFVLKMGILGSYSIMGLAAAQTAPQNTQTSIYCQKKRSKTSSNREDVLYIFKQTALMDIPFVGPRAGVTVSPVNIPFEMRIVSGYEGPDLQSELAPQDIENLNAEAASVSDPVGLLGTNAGGFLRIISTPDVNADKKFSVVGENFENASYAPDGMIYNVYLFCSNPVVKAVYP